MQLSQFLSMPVSRGVTGALVIDEVTRTLSDGKCMICTFINPHAWWNASSDKNYIHNLHRFDFVLCDGVGVVHASKMLGEEGINRLSFDNTSLATGIFQACINRGWRVFLLGGEEGIAATAAEVLRTHYPGLVIAGTYSGYFSDDEAVCARIEETEADIVVCGMGAPRQEEFLMRLKHSGWRGAAFTCGGFLQQLTQRFDYYPAWIDHFNLRFLYRLCKEPRRLGRRYLIEYSRFIFVFGRALLAISIGKSRVRLPKK